MSLLEDSIFTDFTTTLYNDVIRDDTQGDPPYMGTAWFTDKELCDVFKEWRPPKARALVPPYVGEYIDFLRLNKFSLQDLLEAKWGISTQPCGKQANQWITSGEGSKVREKILADAWFYGYTTEQQYYVLMPGGYLNQSKDNGSFFVDDKIETGSRTAKFTKNEILSYDKRCFSFAVKVEEDE